MEFSIKQIIYMHSSVLVHFRNKNQYLTIIRILNPLLKIFLKKLTFSQLYYSSQTHIFHQIKLYTELFCIIMNQMFKYWILHLNRMSSA